MSSVLGGALCCLLVVLVVAAAGLGLVMSRRPKPAPKLLTSEDAIHAELGYTFALMIRGAAAVRLPELEVGDAGTVAAIDAHLAAGRHDAAIRMIDARSSAASTPLFTHLLDRRATACLEKGDWAGAERAARSLMEVAPEDPTRLGPLAVVLARQGRYVDLLALAKQWEELGGTPESRSRYNDLRRALEAVAT